ncbi:transmembrane protein 14A isoform X2 [Stegostoma tigrinum]|uniref:transmembrane protein 14A isoform X2 n=1 Tax=Stegostoma tigrinum TaxID=3053191 RepID=UPI00202B90EF|nr:transmembrane protein 14A isoform X2 [Stegostoma tigrinum]
MPAFLRLSFYICPLVADGKGEDEGGSVVLKHELNSTREGKNILILKTKNSRMSIDWVSFSYAAIVTVGGILGYTRKGSVMSLMSGLLFGSLAGYGAYQVSNDPRNVKISLLTAGILTTVMGVRYKRSGKVIPAGLIAGVSLFMVLRLVFMML